MSGFPTGPELTGRVFDVMRKKAELNLGKVVWLGLLAGFYIGLGSLFSGLVQSYSGDEFSGVIQVLAGAVFTLGLMAVLLAGAELFTGNTLMLGTVVSADLPLSKALRVLPIAYLSNILGALILVALAIGAGLHTFGDGAVGKALHSLAQAKVSKGFWTIFFSGILANFLVCLGVWIAIAGETVTQKFVGLFLPVTAFVALGLEHSIANMSILPFGFLVAHLQADLTPIPVSGIVTNLAAATIGNIIGGAALGTIYGLTYKDKLSQKRSI